VIYFFTLPNLEPVPPALIQPIKNVITFALDELDLRKEYPPDVSERAVDPIGLCVIRKKGIALYGLRERLYAARVRQFYMLTLLFTWSARLTPIGRIN
jgi:hypothetical protein